MGFTVTEALSLADPPGPVHVIVNVAVPAAPGCSGIPEAVVACPPFQLPSFDPDAVHEVALVEVQLSAVEFPSVIVLGDAVSMTVGAVDDGVPHAAEQEVYPVFVVVVLHESVDGLVQTK